MTAIALPTREMQDRFNLAWTNANRIMRMPGVMGDIELIVLLMHMKAMAECSADMQTEMAEHNEIEAGADADRIYDMATDHLENVLCRENLNYYKTMFAYYLNEFGTKRVTRFEATCPSVEA